MKAKTVGQMSQDEIREIINVFIREYWTHFAEDYPKNREFVLDVLDEGFNYSPRPKVRAFWANLKNAFLEAEKTFK